VLSILAIQLSGPLDPCMTGSEGLRAASLHRAQSAPTGVPGSEVPGSRPGLGSRKIHEGSSGISSLVNAANSGRVAVSIGDGREHEARNIGKVGAFGGAAYGG